MSRAALSGGEGGSSLQLHVFPAGRVTMVAIRSLGAVLFCAAGMAMSMTPSPELSLKFGSPSTPPIRICKLSRDVTSHHELSRVIIGRHVISRGIMRAFVTTR